MSRFWTIDSPDETVVTDLISQVDNLIPVVDEEMGGIITYATPETAGYVTAALNAWATE